MSVILYDRFHNLDWPEIYGEDNHQNDERKKDAKTGKNLEILNGPFSRDVPLPVVHNDKTGSRKGQTKRFMIRSSQVPNKMTRDLSKSPRIDDLRSSN